MILDRMYIDFYHNGCHISVKEFKRASYLQLDDKDLHIVNKLCIRNQNL